jgi:BstXI restriction endonuclease
VTGEDSPRLWSFMSDKDKKKLVKAGFATPRGGGKNAYQNHVSRSNRVIVPFERLDDVALERFEHGYVVRLLPRQCFSAKGVLDSELAERGIEIGRDAFILYRSHADYAEALSPLEGWSPRGLGGGETTRKRGLVDTGEYVVRLSNPTIEEGLPQGIFAPEYANESDNLVSRAMLAWLIGRVRETPYDSGDFGRLRAFLDAQDEDLCSEARLEREGIVMEGEARCPLCLRPLVYPELHEILDLSEAVGLANAGMQVEGATRSTAVNLFHMKPLLYAKELHHTPDAVAWGHAICNTLLGQRACVPLVEIEESGVELRFDDGSTWGFSAADESMLRSDDRGVWVRLVERGLADAPLTEVLGAEVVVEDVEDGSGAGSPP